MHLMSLHSILLRAALLVLPCLIVVGTAEGQARRFQEEWRWARFGLDDGLPSLRIESMTEANDGTLWVQTGLGPAWFDGFRWNPVPIEEKGYLTTIEPIHPLGEGGILVKTTSRTLYRVDRTGATPLQLPRKFRRHVILDVLGDGDHGCFLLVQLRAAGEGIRFLWHDGLDVSEFLVPDDLSRQDGVRLVLGSGGEVFLVTADKAWIWTRGRFEGPRDLPEPGWIVKSITSDGFGSIGRLLAFRSGDLRETALWETAADGKNLRRVWTRSRGLVGQLELPGGRTIVVLEGRESQFLESGQWRSLDPMPTHFLGASCLYWTSQGQLCVGTVRGLSICQYDSALWARSAIDGLETGKIHKILGDRNEVLWVLGERGLFSFQIRDLLHDQGLQKGHPEEILATDIVEDARGRLWICDKKGVIYRRVGGRWQTLEEGVDAKGLVTISFLDGDHEGPWIQTASVVNGLPYHRVLRWNETRFVDWPELKQTTYGVFSDMVEAKDGTLWFSGAHGISRFHAGEWKEWNRSEGLRRNRVESLALDSVGRLWFLHGGRALGFLDAEGRVTYANHDELPDFDGPRSLEAGPHGRLWSYTETRLRLLPVQDPGSEATPLDPEELARSWVDIDLPPGWAQQHYLQVHPTSDVLFFLSGEGDLSTFDIRVGDSRPPILELEFPRVHVGGVSMSWKPRSWYGAIPANRVLTRHRLDSSAWSPWSVDHRLDLWSPDPGEHQIHVQARNRLGRQGIAFVSGVFDVPAPFWKRPAFYLPISALLSLLLITLVLWAWNTRRHALVLEVNQKKLETMAEMSPVGILHADHQGMIQFRNQRGVEIVGMDLTNRLPLDYLEAIHEEDRFRVRREWLTSIKEGSQFESRFRFQHPDGTTRWVMGQAVPEHDDKGRVVAYVGTLTDITGMEVAAADRKRLEERLVQAQKLESVGQLAGGIAHDFNNLLQVILGYTDFLDERLSVDGQEDPDLAQIKNSAERATELTRQLLAFSRKQQGRPRPLNPVQVVHDVLTMMRRVLPESITIEFQPGNDVGTICMDGNQFDQVILNLCLNARDAMPDGGVLELKLENVSIVASDQLSNGILAPGRYVLLRVIDTGTGMSEDVTQRLFEPFFTTKEPGKGTGLGMAMVYGIVRQNEGAVEVESEVGQGTDVRIYLPRVEDSLETGVEDSPELEHGRGETILIAEDEDLVRDLARTMLERAGYRVLTAVDGEDAIQKFQEHREEISVVLLDAIMPRCGGREVYERLRKIDSSVKFLFSSGHPANQLPGTFLEENRLVLIPKPYKAKQLLREVRGVLERKARD